MDCICSKPKIVHCKIILLDEQELIHEIEDTCNGQILLDTVFRNLNLLETAYFGLRYLDQTGQTHWLDPSKVINKQMIGPDPYTFYFGVKFYAADPCKLLEEITRYQFFLQVKQDILQERLLVPFELAAELGAYIVQSELGDYDPRRHSKGYVSEFRFLPNQSIELESRIADLHKTLVGQLPSVAELNYLEKIKWLEMYGVDLHPVLGEDNVEYFLGLTPSGIIVLRNKNTVGNYYWPRITKIYFKGRYFMLRVTDKNNDESTYGFETPSKSGCKHLWKCCVEHHAFFRLVQVSPAAPDIFALGSRFRYSGRTEKQAVRDAQMKIRNPPTFSRTPSRRYQRRNNDGAVDTTMQSYEQFNKTSQYQSSQEIKFISVPQPAQNFDESYSTNVVVATPADDRRADSPRSTKSAPWSQPHSKGLYNNSIPISPRSVHSAGPRYRSSSLDSQSSNDSRNCKKRKHRSKLTSDNESELSKSSSRSHRKHRRHRSKGYRRGDSESEQESTLNERNLNKYKQLDQYELVDSDFQWQEVQRKLYNNNENNSNSIHKANVISSNSRRPNNNQTSYNNNNNNNNNNINTNNNNNSTDKGRSDTMNTRNRKHRKHRSRSRSPAEPTKTWLSEEFKKHLEFDLIDTTGMSDSQLKEIPYTVVQTNTSKQIKLKHWNKNDCGGSGNVNMTPPPPPPYSPQFTAEISKLRQFDVSQYGHHHNNENNNIDNLLPRMFENLDLSAYNDYPLAVPHHSKEKEPTISNNNLYRNTIERTHDGYENITEYLRINHEHTDSGLGIEQECLYNGHNRPNNDANGSREHHHHIENHAAATGYPNEDYFLFPDPERLLNQLPPTDNNINNVTTQQQQNINQNNRLVDGIAIDMIISEMSTEL